MADLAAENLARDARVAEAKRLLRAALADHQAGLTGVRPGDPDRKASYAETLARFADERGGGLYYPYLGSGIGRGALVELADGSVKYDFITGIGVHYMGHNHPALLDSGVDAALQNTVMQGNLQQNGDSEALLAELLAAANRGKGRGAKFAHGFLTSSGAMANENAFKILFQKKFPADRVLAFSHGFAGRTLAMSAVTDKAAYRQGVPQALQVDYVPFFDPARPAESTAKALAAIQTHLARHPGRHALMIFELIQGEGAGYLPGDPLFFKTLMSALRDAGVLILADEIQTFGRTGEVFAFQHFGLDEFIDAVTLGKLTQACATLVRSELKPKPGLISQTFTASAAGIKAARVILKAMIEDGYLGPQGRVLRLSDHFRSKLEDLSRRHPKLAAGPFGLGGMLAFTPLGGDSDRVAAYLKNLFAAGVIGFIAGAEPARARFLLPVGGVEESDIDTAFAIIEKVLLDTAAGQDGPAADATPQESVAGDAAQGNTQGTSGKGRP